MLERQQLLDNLKTNLKGLDLDDFVKMLVNNCDAVEQFYKLQHNVKAGNTISLLFNPHRLDTYTSVSDGKSIYSSLQYDNYLDGLARLYLYNLEHNVNKPFYRAIERGFNGIQYVNEFPPFVARTIIDKYNTSDSDKIKVLDPCCGWGGRMIGCASLDNCHYFGTEPATDTYNGLCKLGEWLKTLNPNFEYTIYNKPYEDCYELYKQNGEYDVALTSPPYFNTEIYSDEETNSLNRYSELELWVDKFYKPLISNTMKLLSDKAVFVLNVSSKRYPLCETAKDICDELNYNIEEIPSFLSGGNEKFFIVSKDTSKINSIKRNKLF